MVVFLWFFSLSVVFLSLLAEKCRKKYRARKFVDAVISENRLYPLFSHMENGRPVKGTIERFQDAYSLSREEAETLICKEINKRGLSVDGF